MKPRKLLFFLAFAVLLTMTTHLYAQNSFLEFLTDGHNSATGSLGFIAGGAVSGEVFRADIHTQRKTDLYDATFGFEFTD